MRRTATATTSATTSTRLPGRWIACRWPVRRARAANRGTLSDGPGRLRGLLAAGLVTLAGCSTGPAPAPGPDVAARRAGWVQWKEDRDRLMRSDDSPILPAERASFEGLPYFPY